MRRKQLYAALLGLAVAGGPLSGQVVSSVQQKATPAPPHEEQHIALTQQYRMLMTFARRIEIAEPGEEADVKTNAEKLVNAVDNAAANLDALAKVLDTTQVAQVAAIRKLQDDAKAHADTLKAELANTPMQLASAKKHAIAIRVAAEHAEEAHAKLLAPAASPRPETPKPEVKQ